MSLRVPLPGFAFVGLVLAALGASSVAAEPCAPVFVRQTDAVPVFDSQGTADGAWRGGWIKARPQLVDFDADLDLDLFVAEETGQLRYYRNDGTRFVPDFHYVTDDFAGLHTLFFTRMVDIDTDGDQDLLVQAPEFTINDGGILRELPGAFLYTNVGTPLAPAWANLSAHPGGYFADENGDPIPFATTSPDFTDLEGDGDPDLLMGDPSGAIILYRNVGTPTVPSFRFETSSYQDVVIVFGSCSPASAGPMTLGDLLRAKGPGLRHGFMLFTFHDLNSDDRPDLFIGDQFNPNVYHLLNLGGTPNPDLSCQTENFFPAAGGGAGTFAQNLVPTFGDLDGDGDDDALLGSGVETDTALIYFRNDGTPSNPVLTLVDEAYLPEVDGGKNSAPAFGDVDGDTDLDLFLGRGTAQRVARFENIGGPQDPVLAELDSNWLTVSGSSWLAPEFADLDGDADPDLFVGTNRGDIRWYRNDGAGTSFPEFTDDAFGVNRLFRLHAEANAVPRFLDTDGDGDLDLLLGYFDFQSDATLQHFRNDGRATAPIFVFAEADYQGLGLLGQNLAPALGDVDGDGDKDLVLGNFEGTLELFRNIGTAGAPVFQPEPGFLDIDVGVSSVPFLVDLDGDGRLDLVVGETGGGMNHYRNTSTAANPSAFALMSPAVDAEVDGRVSTLFDWAASVDPETASEVGAYELRLALSPGALANEWWVIGGLTNSQTHLLVQTGEFRFARDFYWTVTAGEPCRGAPVPEWRHAVNTAWLERPPGEDGGTLPKPGSPGGSEEAVGADLPPAAWTAERFGITRVFPTPTRGDVSVELALPIAGAVRVVVYDAAGRRVATLPGGVLSAGSHRVRWDGRTANGTLVAPGVYLIRAELGGRVHTGRIVRLR